MPTKAFEKSKKPSDEERLVNLEKAFGLLDEMGKRSEKSKGTTSQRLTKLERSIWTLAKLVSATQRAQEQTLDSLFRLRMATQRLREAEEALSWIASYEGKLAGSSRDFNDAGMMVDNASAYFKENRRNRLKVLDPRVC